MPHLTFEINFQIHLVSLISPVSIHLINSCQPIFVIIATLIIHHSFTFSLQTQPSVGQV